MTPVGYILLPDARESSRSMGLVNVAISALNNTGSAPYHAPFRPVRMSGPRAWHSYGAAVDPDSMLSILSGIDWAYPARLLYRVADENTWSFVTLGLSPSVLGEGDE